LSIVLVMRRRIRKQSMSLPITRLLCAVDFSPASEAVFAYAERLATATGAEIVLVHAFDLPEKLTYEAQSHPADPHLVEQLDQMRPKTADARVQRLLHAGPPGPVICWLAQEQRCDLIVMGTHGRTRLAHLLLGSVAEHVVRHARCPVLTIREHPAGEPPLPEPLVLPLKAPRMM
jgi:universal stress protein A